MRSYESRGPLRVENISTIKFAKNSFDTRLESKTYWKETFFKYVQQFLGAV